MICRLPRRVRGFSLIEVMIAVVVLSFGLLALSALQAGLFRAGAEAKARSNATALAQNAVENARTFAYVTPPTGYTGPTYTSIASASWGSQAVGGVTYAVAQTVTRYRWNGTAFEVDPSTTGSVNVTTPEFKNVKVAVTWSASDGSTKRIELEDSVAAVAPADSIQVVKTPSKTLGGPQVWIEPPNKDNPAVVPIAVGDDKSAASSNPVPRRFTKVDENTAATLFSVLTFTGSSTGREVLLNRKLDVAGVTCRCTSGTGASYTSSPTNPAFQPTVWNGAQLAYVEPQPLLAGAKIGLFDDSGSSSADIRVMCQTCCRDHHESTSRSQRPDPHRALTSAESNGREHYLSSPNSKDPNLADLTGPLTTGDYSEACQLIRVAGRMRISVDPKQNFVLAVPLNKDETGHEPADFVAQYSGLVVDYLQQGAGSLPAGYLSPTAPFLAFDRASYASKYPAILARAPIDLNSSSPSKQLVAFGLYVDYVSPDTKKAYECALSKSSSSSCDGLRERNPLETLPFYAINVANLGIWSVDKDWFAVSSPSFNNKGILEDLGGLVTFEKAGAPCGLVTFKISRSSSGVAGRLPIDPDDNADPANHAREYIPFTSNGTTTCLKTPLPT